MTAGMMTARDVNAALYLHFSPRYAVLTELVHDAEGVAEYRDRMQARAGYGDPLPEPPPAWQRRVDVLLISKTERIAVEVKVSRSDFLADVRDPAKQATWRALAHRHAFAVPAGLVKPGEVPPDSGLLYVGTPTEHNRWSTVRWERRAPKGNAPPELPARVIHAILHRCARAEARAKGLLTGGDDPEAMRLELERLRADLVAADERAGRERAKAAGWRAAFAAHGDAPCSACAQPIRPEWSTRRALRWRHRDPAHEQACEATRAAVYEAEHPSKYGTPYAPPVEPADADESAVAR